MNTSDAIFYRHSYRGKFLDTEVPEAHLLQIIKAGAAAPSGCNKQTTSFIAVNDKAVLEKLHSVIQPPICETAPAMICVLTKHIFAYRDKCYCVQDYSAAIENMLLAAVELGYESCWIEGHITDTDRIGFQMARILGVTDEYELVAFLPIGKAAENVQAVKKLPLEQRAWLNSFGGKFGASL